jgi:glycolate oxidase FAD binding subunit
LNFGGEVMKNVAGYDVSRLMCGAYGTLGVLLEVSLKVLPRPASETTLTLELDQRDAFTRMSEWQRDPLPLSGLCYDGDRLYVRLSGAEQAVSAARRRIGGETEVDGVTFWERLREQRGAFFEGSGELWRLSVPSTTRTITLTGKQLIDWGGALRWLKTTQNAEDVFAAARAAGGHAMRVRGTAAAHQVSQPLPAPLLALHQRLKKSFDPHGILNPGRLYPEF